MDLNVLKLQDEIVIVILSIILLLLVGILLYFIKNIIVKHSVVRILESQYRKKEYNEVIRLASEYVERNSEKRHGDMLFILYYLAQSYEAINSLSNAVKFYQDALIKAEKNKKIRHSAMLSLAKIYERQNKPKEALSYYLLLIEEDDNNIEVLFELAKFQYQNKNTKKAREYLEKLLAKKPGILDARLLYGRILLDNRNFAQALKQFDLVIKYDDADYMALFYKAKTLEGLKKYNDAVQIYKQLLKEEWDIIQTDKKSLQEMRDEAKISIINLIIKLKDYFTGIQYVSEFLASEASESAKTELIYLYANMLWNSGEEYKALKNYERVFLMNPEFKDVRIIYERYKRIIPHNYLGNYFTSSEDNSERGFDSTCRKILGKNVYDLLYRSIDFYIYAKGGFYIVFYRHIEPLPFSKLGDIQIIMDSFEVEPNNVEIYSLSGIREDAVNHLLLKNSKLIEGDEFIDIVKKTFGA